MNHEDVQSLGLIVLSLAFILHVLTHFIQERRPSGWYITGTVVLIASGAVTVWVVFR